MPRDPALRPYRLSVYLVYGLICGVLFFQLLRSVVGDLYGRRPSQAAQQSPTACLEEMERLYGELSARALQPAPQGLESGALSREWDAWSRRWEADVDRVSAQCGLDASSEPAAEALSEALDAIEELRRRLSRSGEEASEDARRAKQSLAQARKLLGLK